MLDKELFKGFIENEAEFIRKSKAPLPKDKREIIKMKKMLETENIRLKYKKLRSMRMEKSKQFIKKLGQVQENEGLLRYVLLRVQMEEQGINDTTESDEEDKKQQNDSEDNSQDLSIDGEEHINKFLKDLDLANQSQDESNHEEDLKFDPHSISIDKKGPIVEISGVYQNEEQDNQLTESISPSKQKFELPFGLKLKKKRTNRDSIKSQRTGKSSIAKNYAQDSSRKESQQSVKRSSKPETTEASVGVQEDPYQLKSNKFKVFQMLPRNQSGPIINKDLFLTEPNIAEKQSIQGSDCQSPGDSSHPNKNVKFEDYAKPEILTSQSPLSDRQVDNSRATTRSILKVSQRVDDQEDELNKDQDKLPDIYGNRDEEQQPEEFDENVIEGQENENQSDEVRQLMDKLYKTCSGTMYKVPLNSYKQDHHLKLMPFLNEKKSRQRDIFSQKNSIGSPLYSSYQRNRNSPKRLSPHRISYTNLPHKGKLRDNVYSPMSPASPSGYMTQTYSTGFRKQRSTSEQARAAGNATQQGRIRTFNLREIFKRKGLGHPKVQEYDKSLLRDKHHQHLILKNELWELYNKLIDFKVFFMQKKKNPTPKIIQSVAVSVIERFNLSLEEVVGLLIQIIETIIFRYKDNPEAIGVQNLVHLKKLSEVVFDENGVFFDNLNRVRFLTEVYKESLDSYFIIVTQLNSEQESIQQLAQLQANIIRARTRLIEIILEYKIFEERFEQNILFERHFKNQQQNGGGKTISIGMIHEIHKRNAQINSYISPVENESVISPETNNYILKMMSKKKLQNLKNVTFSTSMNETLGMKIEDKKGNMTAKLNFKEINKALKLGEEICSDKMLRIKYL